MGTSTDAVLAYGYDLCGEPWKIREIGEYDEPVLDWYDEEDDSDFAAQAERRLLASIGFTETWETSTGDGYFKREEEAKARLGVTFETYCKDDYPLFILAAHVITVSRGDSEILDLPALMNAPVEHGWDDNLRAACEALGITPTQETPAWVLVSYWG
jgi:hypothetical protein